MMSPKSEKRPPVAAKRGKKIAGQLTKAEAAAAFGLPKLVLTIPEFCSMHGISTGLYFKLKLQGQGPREIHTGARITISLEAAADWRKAREVQPEPAAS